MSLLDRIKSKKSNLHHTDTIVTYIDGRRYLENKDDGKQQITERRYGFVVDTKPDDIPAKIAENLYLGSQDCCDSKVLEKYGITSVLSVGIEAPMKDARVTYRFVECLDLPDTDLTGCLEESVSFIESCRKQFKSVLVHCNAGVSRAASIVIGYLILNCGYTYLDAYNIVKQVRPCIQPNFGFEKQLRNLDKT